ncbi:MAG TPA: helix-turn-helix domain-containing protein [archaeon]|nr:helix-turn-helix domain-containing protein [archaeon]
MERPHAARRKDYFTVKEAAEYLGIKYESVYCAMRTGSLPFQNINGHRHVTREDMDKYKADSTRRAAHKDGLFTVKEAAAYLGVTPALLYMLNKSGRVRSNGGGEHIYFIGEELDAYNWQKNLPKRLRTPTNKDIQKGIGLYEIPSAEGNPRASVEETRPDLFVEMETPESILLREEFFKQSMKAFRQLNNPKKQYVLEQRIIEQRTLEDIASDLKVTGERVRQLEAKALRKFRSIVRDTPYFKKIRFV